MARRHKRLWTDEEKRSICLQTIVPGVSVAQVAQVAQRYALNANLVFKWLRDAPPAEHDHAEITTVANVRSFTVFDAMPACLFWADNPRPHFVPATVPR